MKRPRQLLSALLLMLFGVTASAQEWTVIELPAKVADMPQLVQDRFGCTYEELPAKFDLTHVRFTGTDFYHSDSDNDGRKALQALLKKAKVVDLAQVTDNEESIEHYKKNYFNFEANYPGPRRLYSIVSWSECDSLEHFLFPKAATRFSNGLGGSKMLKKVTWPDKVLHLSYGMFGNCTSLEQIELPDSLDGVPEYCFGGCSALKSVKMPPVGIGSDAFSSCSSLEQITIPEGTETIGDNCFRWCQSLKEVNLPSTVTTIGAQAFDNCIQLRTIQLPQRLKAIAERTFSTCTSLESIVIPDSVTSIGNSAFQGCQSLKQAVLSAGLTSIDQYAFHHSGLEQIDIPDGVTELGESVFEDCHNLKRVHLSRQLTAIPNYLFRYCESLEETNIPYRITKIGDGAFTRCFHLSSLVLQEGLTHLGKQVFYESGIHHIMLPKSLQYIGEECFNYSSLRSVDIPDGVIEIGDYAFANCDSLSRVTLSDGLLYLKNYAFADCPILEDMTLPSSLRIMGEGVFWNNKQKRSYTQPPLINVVPNSICVGCDSLESITLHKRVTEIGPSAFRLCYQLSHVDFPQGLQVIGDNAFRRSALTEFDIPSSVRYIGSEAFSEGLYKRVVLPEGVEHIGSYAFSSDNLRYVDFPSTVSVLGEYAFQGNGPACDSIVIHAALPPRTTGALYTNWLEGTLYVPAATIDAYRQNENFTNCFTSIKPLTDYTNNLIIVTDAYSTDSLWFPAIPNADLTITYNPDYNDGFHSGHLHVGKGTNWSVNHLCFDYRGNESCLATTLFNEGNLSVQSMETNLSFKPNEWLFFTPAFDMKASSLLCSNPRTPYTLRTFDGAQRAAGNHDLVWAKVDVNSTLKAGQGYILQYGAYSQQTGDNTWKVHDDEVSFNMQPSIPITTEAFSTGEVIIPLTDYKSEFPHNAGWNFIANPYMVYFDIEHLDTDNPILISKAAPYKTFEAVSPIDDKFILSPLNAFLIQRGVTQSSVTFHPEGRQSDNNFRFTNNSRALRRQQLRLQRIVYDVALQLHTEQQADVQLASTRIIVTPRATEQYDRGQDAPFISLDDNATALYSRTAGLRYSFNELPPTTATVELGTHLAEAGSYTLSMNVRTRGASRSDIPSHLWLTDRETGSQTDLLTDSYTFTVSEPCTLNSRFVLQLSDGVNAIPHIEASPQQSDHLYDLQGRRINTPAKGFYIKGHKKYVK